MTLLNLQHVGKAYQERVILRDVSFHLAQGEKVGLVGSNGGGKSTLMRILAGVEWADHGDIQWKTASQEDTSYLPQEPAWELAVAVELQLRGVAPEMLSRCGISNQLLTRPAGQLSGGEKTRAALAKAVNDNPALLLLDEPTNHLDVDGLTWLESFLTEFPGALLVVSHDRYFLDQVVHRILELDDGCVREYRGNYSAYAHQKSAERRQQEEAYEQFIREKKRLEDALERKRRWAEKGQRQAKTMRAGGRYDAPKAAKGFYGAASKRMMVGAQAMEQRLDRLHADKPKSKVAIDASLGDARLTGRHLVVAEDVGFHYPGEKWLFRQARFFVERGDKVAVVGRNGSGKTTLIRILLCETHPTEGTVRVSPVRIGYLAQEMETLRLTETLLNSVRRDDISTTATNRARDILAHMLFRDDAIVKRVATLSGGEKVRLAFARILFDSPDFLILDEPTNALDLAAREAIEEALFAFAGTVLFVSHDRYLLQRIATKVLSLEGGTVHTIRGGYEDYLRWRAGVRAGVRETSDPVARLMQPDEGGMQDGGMSLRDRKLVLETRLAVLSQRLAVASDEEKAELTEEFIRTQREVNGVQRRLK